MTHIATAYLAFGCGVSFTLYLEHKVGRWTRYLLLIFGWPFVFFWCAMDWKE